MVSTAEATRGARLARPERAPAGAFWQLLASLVFSTASRCAAWLRVATSGEAIFRPSPIALRLGRGDGLVQDKKVLALLHEIRRGCRERRLGVHQLFLDDEGQEGDEMGEPALPFARVERRLWRWRAACWRCAAPRTLPAPSITHLADMSGLKAMAVDHPAVNLATHAVRAVSRWARWRCRPCSRATPRDTSFSAPTPRHGVQPSR